MKKYTLEESRVLLLYLRKRKQYAIQTSFSCLPD